MSFSRGGHPFWERPVDLCMPALVNLTILLWSRHIHDLIVNTHFCGTSQVCFCYGYCATSQGKGWRRLRGSLIWIGHFPQKWHILSGSLVENDLQLRGSYECSSPCTLDWLEVDLMCCCSVLQCVAVGFEVDLMCCCGVLQCVAVCCSVIWGRSNVLLRCVAVCCSVIWGRSNVLLQCVWCERCLLITESPKTPGHFRYLIWVFCYIPCTGLAVFSYAISRVPVYTAVSIPCEFVFSTL